MEKQISRKTRTYKVQFGQELTPRELEVLAMTLDTRNPKKIAEYLCVEVGAIERLWQTTHTKLGTSGSLATAQEALRRGLITDNIRSAARITQLHFQHAA